MNGNLGSHFDGKGCLRIHWNNCTGTLDHCQSHDTVILACITSFIFHSFTAILIPYLRIFLFRTLYHSVCVTTNGHEFVSGVRDG